MRFAVVMVQLIFSIVLYLQIFILSIFVLSDSDCHCCYVTVSAVTIQSLLLPVA